MAELNIEQNPALLPAATQPFRQVEHLKPVDGETANTANKTSESLSDIFTAAIIANVASIVITNPGIKDIGIEFDGSNASATSATLPKGSSIPIPGPKAEIDKIRIFSDSGITPLSIIQFAAIE